MRYFHVWPNLSFTTSETIGDYYLSMCYLQVAERVAEWLKTEDVRKLGTIRKVSKLYRMIA